MEKRDEVRKEYLSIKEIARMLGVAYATAWKLVQSNMAYVRIGKSYRVRRDELMKYLKRQERASMV